MTTRKATAKQWQNNRRSPAGMTTREATAKQRQQQQQIPCGNDNYIINIYKQTR
jgi:hypothetical protein